MYDELENLLGLLVIILSVVEYSPRLWLNFNYLQAKLAATDTNALIADFDYLADEKELSLIKSAIRLSAHVLPHDARQLAGQLTGRLLGDAAPNIQALLKGGC